MQAFVSGRLAEHAATVITAEQVRELRDVQAEIERIAPEGLAATERIEQLNDDFHRKINHLSGYAGSAACRDPWHGKAPYRATRQASRDSQNRAASASGPL